MEDLLCNHNVVLTMSVRNESTLSRSHKFGKKLSNPPGKGLGDDFVGNVTKAYGPELLHMGNTIHFGNEAKEGVV